MIPETGGGLIRDLSGLPDRRSNVTGQTDDGAQVRLIRSISQKLYRCGGCHGQIEPGDENVVVEYDLRSGASEHSHWHRRCVGEILLPTLRGAKAVPAGGPGQGRRSDRRGRRRSR